jgi:hypothetical protein
MKSNSSKEFLEITEPSEQIDPSTDREYRITCYQAVTKRSRVAAKTVPRTDIGRKLLCSTASTQAAHSCQCCNLPASRACQNGMRPKAEGVIMGRLGGRGISTGGKNQAQSK